MEDRFLIIGAGGQLGKELLVAIKNKHGAENVLATDINDVTPLFPDVECCHLDVTDYDQLVKLIKKHHISKIYHLAAILSAKGEKNPLATWDMNMTGLLNVLRVAVALKIKSVFWPSSVAVFGSNTPKMNTPQDCIMEPETIYGISKLAGEQWCAYYHRKYGLDVRSLRYPGLIGTKHRPIGGTTDYAVEMFVNALTKNFYEVYLRADTCLPMMYMDDAISATQKVMEAPYENILIRTSYNVAGLSFTPIELAKQIQTVLPDFVCHYQSDERQIIADGWPDTIDDHKARAHWEWYPRYNLKQLVYTMIDKLSTENKILNS